jgi:hypothetical protein
MPRFPKKEIEIAALAELLIIWIQNQFSIVSRYADSVGAAEHEKSNFSRKTL